MGGGAVPVETGRRKRFRVPEMEGATARRYARLRGTASQLAAYRAQAVQLTDGLPSGADVLEVAPGPGYLAIELARLGRFHVTGLDISRSFVEIAGDNARRAAVRVDVRHGDAASMPFDDASFDLIVCQAAFKNFTQPRKALDEMHRVLRAGGTAVIQDLSRDASRADIDHEVRQMGLGRLSALMTRWILATMLRRRAYTPARFERLAADSAFGGGQVRTEGISLEVRLTKREAT
jgi:ubiquinone/menaquinone biosynthesis C-methylase UbiE